MQNIPPKWNGLVHLSRAQDLSGDWFIEEKYDGSSLMVFNGEFYNRTLLDERLKYSSNSAFSRTVAALQNIELNPNYAYYGEAFRNAYHNYISYGRMPRHYFMCYDIFDVSGGRWLTRQELEYECAARTLECARVLASGISGDITLNDVVAEIMSNLPESSLGGKMEGIVIKMVDREVIRGYKKERDDLVEAVNSGKLHAKFANLDISADNFLSQLGLLFATEARRRKAIQHIDERGESPSKCTLSAELDADFDREYKNEIMEYLYNELGPVIKHHAQHGLTHIDAVINDAHFAAQ